jgi:hypothetical protein
MRRGRLPPEKVVPMNDKFRPGQVVRLCRSPYRSSADGEYKVVRSLPTNGGEPEYRVKSMREPYERVVKESEIEKT